MKYLLLLLPLLLVGCAAHMQERKWDTCSQSMYEDFALTRHFNQKELPDVTYDNCQQVMELVNNGAEECNFDTNILDTVCKNISWYDGTEYVKVEGKLYERVDPCEDKNKLEIQGCSAVIYFVERYRAWRSGGTGT